MEYCCDRMKNNINSDKVVYDEDYDEFGVPIAGGQGSYNIIHKCPFCGAQLPESDKFRFHKKI